jgi:hypothetical protein
MLPGRSFSHVTKHSNLIQAWGHGERLASFLIIPEQTPQYCRASCDDVSLGSYIYKIKREKLVLRKCGNAVGWLAAGEFTSGRDRRSQGHLASVRRCGHIQHRTPWTSLPLRVGGTETACLTVTVGDQLLTISAAVISVTEIQNGSWGFSGIGWWGTNVGLRDTR